METDYGKIDILPRACLEAYRTFEAKWRRALIERLIQGAKIEIKRLNKAISGLEGEAADEILEVHMAKLAMTERKIDIADPAASFFRTKTANLGAQLGSNDRESIKEADDRLELALIEIIREIGGKKDLTIKEMINIVSALKFSNEHRDEHEKVPEYEKHSKDRESFHELILHHEDMLKFLDRILRELGVEVLKDIFNEHKFLYGHYLEEKLGERSALLVDWMERNGFKSPSDSWKDHLQKTHPTS